MACEYLEYHDGDDEHSFETDRAYCTVVDRFVQPMRADVCNERYGLSPGEHCEFFEQAESDE